MINCEFENGNKASLRHVCANMIILNEQKDAVLLARRAPQLLDGGKWCLPGGYMERDRGVAETACIEALEETGYSVTPLGLVCVSDEPKRGDSGRQNVVFVFAGVAGEKVAAADDESTEQRWFKLDTLPPTKEWAFDHQEMMERYLTQGFFPITPGHLFLKN